MRVPYIPAPGAACVAAVALLAACQSRERQSTGGGGETASSAGAVALRPFNGNVQQARAGRQEFLNFNCYGCHGGLAGGAMGPSLRDTVWKFGGTDQAIYASIRDGRPGGMPKWGGTIPDSGIRSLIVYIRSLRTNAEPTFFFSPTDTTTHASLTASP